MAWAAALPGMNPSLCPCFLIGNGENNPNPTPPVAPPPHTPDHHPGDHGHKIMSDLAVHLLQRTAHDLLQLPYGAEDEHVAGEPLPPPMYPGACGVWVWGTVLNCV